jgi:hypothetical protein
MRIFANKHLGGLAQLRHHIASNRQ